MTPFQQLYLGLGAKKKTYIDDVFSTYLFKGTQSTLSINNGINLSGGGLVWLKNRDNTSNHTLFDTTRGTGKILYSDGDWAEYANSTTLTSYNNNGFTLGSYSGSNASGDDYSSWSFAKAKGFFDVVTYTGNGSNRTIAHSLGSVPGMIMVKRTDSSADWRVYYRGSDGSDTLKLNSGVDVISSPSSWNSTLPTATHFSLGTQTETNANGGTFIAYLFAGGASTAAAARSVIFTSGDWLETPSSTDYNVGTGDFCIECWIKPTSYTGGAGPYGQPSNGLNLQHSGSDFGLYKGSTAIAVTGEEETSLNQWSHVAATRSSGTIKLFINGTCKKTVSNSNDLDPDTTVGIYVGYGVSAYFNGKVSNLRFVKGSAVYTSSFRPPTEPLTNITNTKLLCCNSSTAGGTTVGSLTAYSSPPVSTDSPFDDPAAFTFGKDGDQGIIKCGSFVGNHTNKPEINLGWEPQYLLWKNADQSQDWFIVDSMRGAVSGANDNRLRPNTTVAENTGQNPLSLTSTGFKCTNTDFNINGNGDTTVYIAIRRPDGYVGKPAEAGTDVFAMDTGDDSATIPNYDSGFPVDFAFKRLFNSSNNWQTSARLIQGKYLDLNDDGPLAASSGEQYDSNVGYNTDESPSTVHAWMWKRGAGFDVLTYTGNGLSDRKIPHSLSQTPEMMWVKRRSDNQSWMVYHKGANGGTDPADKYLELDGNSAEADDQNVWQDTVPTATVFTVGSDIAVNNNNDTYIAILFASVAGVSKVGSYTGTGSSFSVDCGFQPRFLVIRRTDSAGGWRTFDTSRGWTSSDNNMLLLNADNGPDSGNYVNHNSTGFTLTTSADVNASSGKYIFYAHA